MCEIILEATRRLFGGGVHTGERRDCLEKLPFFGVKLRARPLSEEQVVVAVESSHIPGWAIRP